MVNNLNKEVNHMEQLKTSAEWAREPEFKDNIIVDKWGWYKTYLNKVWTEELISKEDYRKREFESNVIYGASSSANFEADDE